MPSNYYQVPEQFAGKSLKQLRGELSDPFRTDILSGMLGIGEDQPFTAGQTFEFAGGDPGSAEQQFITNRFQAGKSPGEQLLERQKGEEQEFLGRFTQAVEGLEPLTEIRDRLAGELGLDEARAATQRLSQTIESIPETEQNIAEQVGVSAPRMQRRIEQRTGEVAPDFRKAISAQSVLEEQLGERLSLAAQERLEPLMPFQVESSLLSDRLSREMTGYTADLQAKTSELVQKLANEGTLAAQEMQNLVELTKLEDEYASRQLITTADGRKLLINSRTGETIRDFGGGGIGNGNPFVTTQPTEAPQAATTDPVMEEIWNTTSVGLGSGVTSGVDLSGIDISGAGGTGVGATGR